MVRVLAFIGALVPTTACFATQFAYPAFSPDGTKLVFSSDAAGTQDLYLVDRDGTNLQRLTVGEHSETQPTWSPDGKSVAYVVNQWNPSSHPRLYVLDLETRQPRRVPGLSRVHLPFWAADGRIYLSLRVNGRDDIVSVLPDGSDLVNHSNTPEVDETNVSVRGGVLAYDRQDGDDYVIELADLDGGTKRVLRRGVTEWDPTWMPDGNSLLVGVYASRDATRSVLTQVDLEGNVVRGLTPADKNVFWPTVSADGRSVVFSYSAQDFGVGELFQLDLEDGTIRPLLRTE